MQVLCKMSDCSKKVKEILDTFWVSTLFKTAFPSLWTPAQFLVATIPGAYKELKPAGFQQSFLTVKRDHPVEASDLVVPELSILDIGWRLVK